MEPGYDPSGLMAARVSELATVALLGGYLVAWLVGQRSVRPW